MLNVISGLLAGGVAASTNSYESISTVTVGSGGSSSISFSSIPSTYKHLQVRLIARSNRSGFSQDVIQVRYNGDTGSNYTWHSLEGNGTSATAGAGTSTANPWVMFTGGATATASVFNGGIVDVLDYTNTNKYKTTRCLSGFEQNTSESRCGLSSTLWSNTAAISSIEIAPIYGTAFTQYSQFALFGVKG